MSMKYRTVALIAVLALAGPLQAGRATVAAAQHVTKEAREGIKNFARVETTVACAGAITADAMPEATVVAERGGRTVTVPYHPARSTSALAAAIAAIA